LICYSNNNNLDALKYILLAGERGYPKDNTYMQNLGIAYIDAGKFNEGIAILNDVLKKRPADLNLLDMIAQSYYESGKYDEAMNDWDAILGYDKSNASALYMIGMCYLKKGDKSKGTQLCDKAIQMDPSLAMYKQKREMSGF
jgi:tetratricopeptide (TPR) repeat protein